MSGLIDQYAVTLEFSVAFALFALATYIALRGGILSLAAVPLAAVAGFVSLVLVEDHGVAIELILIIGVFVGIASGFVASLPLLRLESHWVALASIAFVLMTWGLPAIAVIVVALVVNLPRWPLASADAHERHLRRASSEGDRP